jgi:hypothetical protein
MSKKNTAAPDYSQLAQASKESAKLMEGLGRDQLAFSKKQYEENAPLLKEIGTAQKDSMAQQMQQGKDYYAYLKDTYRPLEKGIVADAQRFDTDAYRNQLATKAAADTGLAFNRTRQANERAMASMGVNPNSGRYQGMSQQAGLSQAATRAGAMTGTRVQAQQMGYARKLDAAGLGRNLAGSSTAAYGSAVNAGSAAGGSFQSAGLNRMSGMGMGSSTIGAGQNMQIQGLSNVLNNQTSYMMNQNDNATSFADIAGAAGGLMGGAAGLMTASDPRLKDNVEKVGKDEKTGLNLYEFNYKWDERRFVGVMADEVQKLYPEAVGEEQGFLTVNYDMLGLEMKEIH